MSSENKKELPLVRREHFGDRQTRRSAGGLFYKVKKARRTEDKPAPKLFIPVVILSLRPDAHQYAADDDLYVPGCHVSGEVGIRDKRDPAAKAVKQPMIPLAVRPPELPVLGQCPP